MCVCVSMIVCRMAQLKSKKYIVIILCEYPNNSSSIELDEIQTLKRVAKEMGIEDGPELTAFLRHERDRVRKVPQRVGIVARELETRDIEREH